MKRCSVPHCAATSLNNPDLCYHRFPTSEDRRKRWIKRMKLDIRYLHMKAVFICSLHFRNGQKTFSHKDPTIFPWSEEWPSVIDRYNDTVKSNFLEVLAEVPCSSEKLKDLATPLPLPCKIHCIKDSRAHCADRQSQKASSKVNQPSSEVCSTVTCISMNNFNNQTWFACFDSVGQ